MQVFVVTVTCAVHIGACALLGTMSHDLSATNEANCKKIVIQGITEYGQNPKNFNIKCVLKGK